MMGLVPKEETREVALFLCHVRTQQGVHLQDQRGNEHSVYTKSPSILILDFSIPDL